MKKFLMFFMIIIVSLFLSGCDIEEKKCIEYEEKKVKIGKVVGEKTSVHKDIFVTGAVFSTRQVIVSFDDGTRKFVKGGTMVVGDDYREIVPGKCLRWN